MKTEFATSTLQFVRAPTGFCYTRDKNGGVLPGGLRL
jgi:hypothetical protein